MINQLQISRNSTGQITRKVFQAIIFILLKRTIYNTLKLYDYFNKRLDREIKEVGAEKVAKYEKMIEGKIPHADFKLYLLSDKNPVFWAENKVSRNGNNHGTF